MCLAYRQLSEMRTKLEQLKQLEAAYTELQMMRDSEAGTMSRPATEAGTKSQSPPRGRVSESGGRIHESVATAAVQADDVDDESSFVAPSPAPPSRPRPPKNYRSVNHIPVISLV